MSYLVCQDHAVPKDSNCGAHKGGPVQPQSYGALCRETAPLMNLSVSPPPPFLGGLLPLLLPPALKAVISPLCIGSEVRTRVHLKSQNESAGRSLLTLSVSPVAPQEEGGSLEDRVRRGRPPAEGGGERPPRTRGASTPLYKRAGTCWKARAGSAKAPRSTRSCSGFIS